MAERNRVFSLRKHTQDILCHDELPDMLPGLVSAGALPTPFTSPREVSCMQVWII